MQVKTRVMDDSLINSAKTSKRIKSSLPDFKPKMVSKKFISIFDIRNTPNIEVPESIANINLKRVYNSPQS